MRTDAATAAAALGIGSATLQLIWSDVDVVVMLLLIGELDAAAPAELRGTAGRMIRGPLVLTVATTGLAEAVKLLEVVAWESVVLGAEGTQTHAAVLEEAAGLDFWAQVFSWGIIIGYCVGINVEKVRYNCFAFRLLANEEERFAQYLRYPMEVVAFSFCASWLFVIEVASCGEEDERTAQALERLHDSALEN